MYLANIVIRFTTSAKQNTNISNAFLYLVGEMLKCDPEANEFTEATSMSYYFIVAYANYLLL